MHVMFYIQIIRKFTIVSYGLDYNRPVVSDSRPGFTIRSVLPKFRKNKIQ